MKKIIYSTVLCLLFFVRGFGQKETRSLVLTKNDYVILEEKNRLVDQAINNAFGESNKQNNYKLELRQVTVWNSRVKEFKYFPEEGDNRSVLKTKAIRYPDNYDLNFRITIEKEKSQISPSIKPYLDKKNTFTVNVVVIGHPKIMVTEVKSKEKYFSLIDEKSFVDKVFKNNFGDPQTSNYKIAFSNYKATVMKDLFKLNPIEEFDLPGSNENYTAFSEKITSETYKGGYILFEIPIIRSESKLTAQIEQAIIKSENGTEYIKFYFCIPPENSRETPKTVAKTTLSANKKPTSTGSIKGIMVIVNSKINPLIHQKVELRNSKNELVQSKQTDERGHFEFKDVDLSLLYSIELPDYQNEEENTKVYLANTNNELVKEFVKNSNNSFFYKMINADVFRLSTMNEEDIELTFLKQKELNKSQIIIEDFVHYDINSSEILPDSKPILEKVIKLMKENKEYHLEIISHTDSRGEVEENLKLSVKRSESVMQFINSSNSIDANRLKPIGMGETKPLNTCAKGRNCLEDEFRMNRRTEFVFKRS